MKHLQNFSFDMMWYSHIVYFTISSTFTREKSSVYQFKKKASLDEVWTVSSIVYLYEPIFSPN